MINHELFEKSKKLVPGGVHSPVRSFKYLHTTPRFINRSEGAYLYDEEGQNFIDFCQSFGPLIHGHKRPEVKAAVLEAIERGWTYGACEKYSLELADYIVSRIDHIEQIRFMNSGTEAVMTAIRLARGVTGRNKIIKFSGCYHGHMDSMLIKAGSGLAGESEASSKGIATGTAQDTIVCDLGDIKSVEAAFDAYLNDIAAIFIEPLPANNGLLIQKKSFLQELRDLATKHSSLLVFDEVISGFRVNFQGMPKELGIIPDIVTYGKVIGGGFPVGAVASSKEIMEHLAPIGDVYQAGTLSANPVAMAAGLANLRLATSDFYHELETQSNKVVATFRKFFQEHDDFKDYKIIQYKSLFWPLPTSEQLKSPEEIPQNLQERFYELFKHCLDRGVYLSPNAYEIGFGSSAHTDEIVQELESRLWK